MAAVRTDSSGMEFDINKALLPHWDTRLEADLFSGVELNETEIERSTLCRSIFGHCAISIGKHIQIAELIPYMRRRGMLTGNEEFQLMSEHLSKEIKATRLVSWLPGKGAMLTPIALFYCSLLESSSAEDGLACHYVLAQRLREAVHQVGPSVTDIKEHDKLQKGLTQVIRKVQDGCCSDVSTKQKLALISRLNLTAYRLSGSETLSSILGVWRQHKDGCNWKELVEALVLVPKLGYLVSNLLSPCLSNPSGMCRFVHKLEERWPILAYHLGYPQHLIRSIQDQWSGDYHEQVEVFLRIWVFPDCKEYNNIIVGKLRLDLDKQEEEPRSPATAAVPTDVSDIVRSISSSPGEQLKRVDTDTPMQPVYGFSGEGGGAQPDISCKEESLCDSAKFKGTEEACPSSTVEGDTKQSGPCPEFTPDCEVKLNPLEEVTTSTDTTVGPEEHEVQCCQELLRAIKENDKLRINHLLENLTYTECRGRDKKTPFLLFCANGMREQIELIVLTGAAVDVIDDDGNCCFHYKEVLKNSVLMKILLSIFDERNLKFPVNVINKHGVTPLMVACKLGDPCYDSVQMLLAHGADPNGSKSECAKSTPLIIASQDNCENLVQLLFDYGANIDGQDRDLKTTALIQACAWAHTGLVSFLLEKGANVSIKEKNGIAALSAAVRKNATDIIQLLIKYSANVNERNFAGSFGSVEETPLAIACANGFQDAAELLIRSGARTDYRCSGQVPPIGFAIIRRKLAMVLFMLQNTPSREKSVYTLATAFNIAMTVDNYDAAGLLLSDYGDRALLRREAGEKGLMQFVDQINSFERCVEIGFAKEPPKDLSHASSCVKFEEEKAKVEEVLQQFCKICMKAATNSCDCEVLATSAALLAGNESAARYFRNYQPLMSPKELKSGLVSGGRESALNFLIGQEVLTIEVFHATALQIYNQNGPDEFYHNLAMAVHTIRGSDIMSFRPNDVLEFMLSGRALLVEQSVPISQAQPTWEESPFMSSGAASSVHEYSSGATGFGSAQPTGSGGFGQLQGNFSHHSVDAEKGKMSRRVDYHGVSGWRTTPQPLEDASRALPGFLKGLKINKNIENNRKPDTPSAEDKVKPGNKKSEPVSVVTAQPPYRPPQSKPMPAEQSLTTPTTSSSSVAVTHESTKPFDSPKVPAKQPFSATLLLHSQPSNQGDNTPCRPVADLEIAKDIKGVQGMHHSASTPVIPQRSYSHGVPSPPSVQQQSNQESPHTSIQEEQKGVPLSTSTEQFSRKRQYSEPLMYSQPKPDMDCLYSSCPPGLEKIAENTTTNSTPKHASQGQGTGHPVKQPPLYTPSTASHQIGPSTGAHPSSSKVDRVSTPQSESHIQSKELYSKSSLVSPLMSSLSPIAGSAPDSHSHSEASESVTEDNIFPMDNTIAPQLAVASTPLRSSTTPNMPQGTSTVTTGMESRSTHSSTKIPPQDLPTTISVLANPFTRTTDGSSLSMSCSGPNPTDVQNQSTLEGNSSLQVASFSKSTASLPETAAGNSSLRTDTRVSQTPPLTRREHSSSQVMRSSSMPYHSHNQHQFQFQSPDLGRKGLGSSSLTPGGAYSREVSRESTSSYAESLSCSSSDLKVFRATRRLRSDKLASLHLVTMRLQRLQSEGFNRVEVTVCLGEEPAGIYWFMLPGTSTISAIRHALDEASYLGCRMASLEFHVRRSPQEDEQPEDPDTQDWECLNPTEATSNLRLLELRLRNAYRNGSRNMILNYQTSGACEDYEEELTEDASSDVLAMLADDCCCSEVHFNFF